MSETPETGIEESDPNADSAEGLAGGMGVSSERKGPVRGSDEDVTYGTAPTHLDEPPEGETPPGAVGVRRAAGGTPGQRRAGPPAQPGGQPGSLGRLTDPRQEPLAGAGSTRMALTPDDLAVRSDDFDRVVLTA